MNVKLVILGMLMVLGVFLSACSSPEKPIETGDLEKIREEVIEDTLIEDTENPEGDVTNIVCTSEFECPNDYSCYYELPIGPTAGIQGSPGNPGKCYSDQMVGQIYSPGTSGEAAE